MISHTIKFKGRSILLNLYKTLVRPHVEYSTPVWSPHYVKDKQMLEKVQHRFTRMVPGVKHLSYENRLRSLVSGHWKNEEIGQICWKCSKCWFAKLVQLLILYLQGARYQVPENIQYNW